MSQSPSQLKVAKAGYMITACVITAMKQDPHIGGVHWTADCVKQWFIILGSIDYNYTFYRLKGVATPPIPWNGIEIAFWSKKRLALFLTVTFQQLTPSLACVQTPPPFISGVVVILTLLGTVASDVFKLTFWNAGALQFLDNRFSVAVVGKLHVWAGNFQEWVFLHCFHDVIYGVFPYGCLFVPHAGFWVFDNTIACENSRFSSLLVAGDVSQGGTSATPRQKFHTDDVKSVRNPVISADWTTE